MSILSVRMISIVNDQNKEFTFTVGGVFTDMPDNSSFRIDILSHFDNFLADVECRMMLTGSL